MTATVKDGSYADCKRLRVVVSTALDYTAPPIEFAFARRVHHLVRNQEQIP